MVENQQGDLLSIVITKALKLDGDEMHMQARHGDLYRDSDLSHFIFSVSKNRMIFL
jgi:hypothetical protein